MEFLIDKPRNFDFKPGPAPFPCRSTLYPHSPASIGWRYEGPSLVLEMEPPCDRFFMTQSKANEKTLGSFEKSVRMIEAVQQDFSVFLFYKTYILSSKF